MEKKVSCSRSRLQSVISSSAAVISEKYKYPERQYPKLNDILSILQDILDLRVMGIYGIYCDMVYLLFIHLKVITTCVRDKANS